MIRCEYFDNDASKHDRELNQTVGQIVLQPNHSLSWRALKYFLAFMMAVSFGIALTFVFFGYWLVLPVYRLGNGVPQLVFVAMPATHQPAGSHRIQRRGNSSGNRH